MNPVFGLICGFFLAFANGANDNFKGVATLFGSGTAHYKGALLWATFTTALGSLAALLMAKGLLAAFSGKGLVPDTVLILPSFPLAVGLAAAVTVWLATRLGLPISTTHALVGGLVGAALTASPAGIRFENLIGTFFLPLLASPLLAIIGTCGLHPLLRTANRFLGIRKETCLCIGREVVGVVPAGISPQQAVLSLSTSPSLAIDTVPHCIERYGGRLFGIRIGPLLDRLHYLSAGAVSFARGLNDTPKIAAILLAGSVAVPTLSIVGAGLFIAAGGLISARKVANTISLRITEMNHAQGLTANLVTSVLVIFASRLGLPVSTTHVSCGALFGLGAVTGEAQWKTIAGILSSWLVTLPAAAVLGGLFFEIQRNFNSL